MPDILISAGIILLVAALLVVAILLFRAMIFGRLPDAVEPLELAAVDGDVVGEHLALALRQATVSDLDRSKINYSSFHQLHGVIEQMYPRVHATLLRETVNEHSLLYTWKGRSPDLAPVMLLAHQDVVPVDPTTREEWIQAPFNGEVIDGFVWGRGALDMKSSLIAVLEAVENLIKTGYQPERTLYLGFGHDEEIGGTQGAARIAALLEERGEKLAAVLDEGGSLVAGVLPGLDLPVALIGVSEKGYVTLELRVEGRPGHSSAPPKHTSIGVLARALARLESAPMPPHLKFSHAMFQYLGAFLPLVQRLVFANTWLFGGLIRRRFERNPQLNAMIRTTTAVTVMRGGVKDNVLPAVARAMVNFRLLPGDSAESVLEHVRKAVHDEAVQVQMVEGGHWEASPVSQADSPVFQDLSRTIRQVFPEAVVAPYLVQGATDSRHYTNVCPDVFRFSPYLLDPDLLRTIHGNNERVSTAVLARMVQFYGVLIKSWTGEG